MFFVFIQCSVCGYTIDLYNTSIIGKGTFLSIFLEPFDEVEIKVNQSTWVLISEWTYAKKLLLNVYAQNSNKNILEFGPFNSNSKLMCLHFDSINYSMKFSSESESEQIIGFIFLPDYKLDLIFNIPEHGFLNFPFLNRYPDVVDAPNGETFIYDADISEGIISFILMGTLLVLFFLIWLYSDIEYLKTTAYLCCCNPLPDNN